MTTAKAMRCSVPAVGVSAFGVGGALVLVAASPPAQEKKSVLLRRLLLDLQSRRLYERFFLFT